MSNDPVYEDRFITVKATPGQDPEVDWSDFAVWEAIAALERAVQMIEECEQESRQEEGESS